MPLIASIDGPNRLIHLHADTVGTTILPIDIYKEMRTLRRSDENLRKYDRFLDAAGNIAKGGGKFTERYVIEKFGTRIVPFDTSQELTVAGTIITDDGQEGIACFDRTPLTATTVVDINYIPPQVEVITITTGSGVIPQDIIDIADAVWNEATAGHQAAGSTGKALTDGNAPTVQEIVDGVLDEDISTHLAAGTVGRAIEDGDATAITIDNAAIADAVWDEALADHLTVGSMGEKLSTGSALDLDSIADAVWDEFLNDHIGAGSAGERLTNAGDVSVQNIVDGVWDAPKNAHQTADTMGEVIQSVVAVTDNAAIAAAVWDSLTASHVTVNTFGEVVQNALSTSAIAAAVTADMDLNSNLLAVIRTAVETDIPATLAGLNDFDPVLDTVMLVDTVTTNTDMRGTDGVVDYGTQITALHAIEFNARSYDKLLNKVIVHDGVLLTDPTLYEWNTSSTNDLTTLEPV